MTVTILYFAKARDLAGVGSEELELGPEVRTLRDLLRQLEREHPPLRGALEQMRVARNEAFAELDEHACHGDVIALIPPIAGG